MAWRCAIAGHIFPRWGTPFWKLSLRHTHRRPSMMSLVLVNQIEVTIWINHPRDFQAPFPVLVGCIHICFLYRIKIILDASRVMCFLALPLLACISLSSNRPTADSKWNPDQSENRVCAQSKEDSSSVVARLSHVFHDFLLLVFTSLWTTLTSHRADLDNRQSPVRTKPKTLWSELASFSWSTCWNMIPLWETEAGKCVGGVSGLITRDSTWFQLCIAHSLYKAPGSPAPWLAWTCLSLNNTFKNLRCPPESGDVHIPLRTMGYLSPLHNYHQIQTVSVK